MMADPPIPTNDVIAQVLTQWLADRGYPVAGLETPTLVSVEWLFGELAKVREGNPSPDLRTTPGKRWNDAVSLMERVLLAYCRRAREQAERGGSDG